MKIGFLTNSLSWAGLNDIEKLSSFAKENNFKEMEIGPSIDLDEKAIQQAIDETGVSISGFIYCRNFLDTNPQRRSEHKKNLIDRIKFAPKVGATKVICSTGITNKSILEGNSVLFDPTSSLEEVVSYFKEIVEVAEKNKVKICFEMCPTMFNIAISPYMWDLIFDRIQSNYIGLAYDPSHLVWQQIEPYENIIKYANKIFHVHGKDCQVQQSKLAQIGILHRVVNKDTGGVGENALDKLWWRYRLPGLGDLQWNRIISNLHEIGYTDSISIEHEDPVWEGSLEKVSKGILKAKKHLEQYI